MPIRSLGPKEAQDGGEKPLRIPPYQGHKCIEGS
jgi:hypothetical protein